MTTTTPGPLILLRHGQSEWNEKNLFTGWVDVGLTELGRAEARRGGELLVEDSYGTHSVKLPSGDLVLYPATSLHKVNPVTRGVRVASFFWVQSMVRDDAQRTLLFDLDMAIVRLTRDAPGHEALVSLTGSYHNLLRMWAEV